MKTAKIMIAAILMAGCTSAQATVTDFTPAEEPEVLTTAAEPEAEEKTAPEYEYYDAYAQMEGEVYTAESIFTFLHSDDKDYMYEQAENIVIGHVISIDRGSNWNEIGEDYCYPYTLGKFVVLKSLKGDLEEDVIYQYGRTGGYVTAEEHYASRKEEGDKLQRMTGTNPDYIGQFPAESPRIEVGKTYLMYIIDASGVKDTCAILSGKGGLRETDELFPEDYTQVKVMNGFTEEWESLADVVPGL